MKRLIRLALLLPVPVLAQVSVEMHQVSTDGVGEKIGSIAIEETEKGVLLKPKLSGLPAGAHGFHLHENGSCEAGKANGKPTAAGAAGGHYDPQTAGTHAGPYGKGHLGDLPVLYVKADGSVNDPVLAPLPKLSDFRGRALVIHAGGDTYTDEPKLGGGGERIGCGVVPKG